MQKFMKIVVAFLLVISLGLPSAATSPVAAEQWTEYPSKTTGDVNKAWKVTFSDQVNSDTVSQQNVYVKRENGTNVDVEVVVNGSTITVTPKAPYTIGETYTLYLHSSIQSVKEQSLPNTKFQFAVLGALEIAKSVAQEAKITAEAIKIGQPVFANPFAGTKDEITRANKLVADLEKAIATAKEKVEAATNLIKIAEKEGYTMTQLARANTDVTVAKKAITEAEKAVTTAKQAIETASISSQLPVAKVEVKSFSNVDVTLVTAPAYELTKSDADKFKVNIDGKVVQVTDVVKSTSDDKKYTLTIATATSKNPLIGKQGFLSVNNTKATITNSEFGYDFKAPTIESVEVVDRRHVKINLSENMGDSAAVVGNYDVYKSTATTTDLLTGTGAVAVLSADRKSVTLTLSDSNPLVAASYTLKVTGTVRDAAGNNLSTNTTVGFTATASDLIDNTRPSLTAADYDSSSGVLNVTFDEKVKIVDISKFSLAGVALASKNTISSNEGTKYQITLSDTTKLDVNNIIKSPLRLTISAGAVEDVASNSNALTNFDLIVVIPPKAIQASYSEYTKRLRVTFDQPIQMASVDKAKISVTVKGTTRTLIGGTIQSLVDGTTLIIELTQNDSKAIESSAGEAVTGTVNLVKGAVKNTTDHETENGDQVNIPLTYIQDTGKPSIEDIQLTAISNYDNDTIAIEFTEPMDPSSAMDYRNYKFEHSDGTLIELTKENTAFEMSEKNAKVTIELKGINLQHGEKYNLTINNIIDLSGEMIDAYTGTNKIVEGDDVGPKINSVSGSATDKEDTVTIEFSEAVKKESVEKLATYTIKNKNYKDSKEVTIDNAKIVSKVYVESDTNNDGIADKFEVVIKYPAYTLSEHGELTASVTEIKNLAGIEISSDPTRNTKTSETISDGVAPTIKSVQGRTVQDGVLLGGVVYQDGLDEIIVEFSENIDETSAQIKTNYTLEVEGKPVSLTNLKAKDFVVENNSVTIKLNTSTFKDGYDVDDYALKNKQQIKLTVNNVTDLQGNKVSQTTMTGKVDHDENDETVSQFKEAAKNAKVTGANTIRFTWDEEIDLASLQASDFTIVDGTVNYQITELKLDSETKKTVTITTKQSIEFNKATLKLDLSATGEFTDLAGNAIKKTADSSVTIAALGSTTEYSLTAGVAEKVVPVYVSAGNNKRISDVFKLTTGTTNNGEGFKVDTITFLVETDALFIDELQLMWSNDAVVGNDKKVSTLKIDVPDGDVTFSAINEEIASGDDGYFYLVAKASHPGEVTLSLRKATAKASQTGVSVATTGVTPGTKVTIDTVAPTAAFESSNDANTIVVLVTEESSLASARSKAKLLDATEIKSLFEIVGANTAKTTINSVKYKDSAKTITITTSAGLLSNEFIGIKAGELQDEAGNPLAATYIAQGNGTNAAYVDPYELMNSKPYAKNILQNATGKGPITYGPSSGTKVITSSGDTVTITGNITGSITLDNVDISGNLIINTPDASVTLGRNVTVGGTLIIEDISAIGLTNNGVLKKDVAILDPQGTSFINNNSIAPVNVDVNIPTSTALVKLWGAFSTVNVLKSAKIQVENGATVGTLTVNNPFEVTVTNNGIISLLDGTGIAFVNGTDAVNYAGTVHANTALAAINRATTAGAVGEALNKYSASTALSLDLTDYEKLALSYQTAVHSMVYNTGKDYTAIGNIQTEFNDAVAVQKVASNIEKTLAVTTNGQVTVPEVPTGYSISVASTTNATVYRNDGIGLKAGTSTVVFTVTQTASGKKATTGNITVEVKPSETGVYAIFDVTQGEDSVAGVAPSSVTLAGLTFTAPVGEELNGYKFKLGTTVTDDTATVAMLDGKVVTISGDFSNGDSKNKYATASEVQTAIRKLAGLASITVTGTVIQTAAGTESAAFAGGIAKKDGKAEIFTITINASGGVTAGTVRFTIGGKNYDIPVTNGMEVNTIASELSAKISTSPVTGYTVKPVAANVVTLTADSVGNKTDLTRSISNQ